MSEISFALRAERVLESLLERLGDDEALADLDADLIDGVLRVDFDSGAVLIINRQEPVQQLWVASPEGPAHFSYDAARDAWLDERSGEALTEVLSRVFSRQTGAQIRLEEPL